MSFFYLGQGYALGSLVLLLPLYITNEFGRTYTFAVVLSTVIIIPWYLKFIFGILSDNYPISKYGRRKPYLVLATVFSFIGWSTIGLHDSATFWFFMSGFLLALGSSIADSVIDGQIVEITPAQLSGRTQGIAWGSRGLGLGLAAMISPLLVSKYSWNDMFNVAAIFGVSISIVTLLLPQKSIDFKDGNRIQAMIGDMKNYFSKNSDYRLKQRVAFMFYSGSAIAVIPMIPIIMEREFGYSYEEIGFGSFNFAMGALIGSLIIGYYFEKNDTFKAYKILSILYGIALIIGILIINIEIVIIEYIVIFLLGFFSSGYESYQLKTIQDSSIVEYEGSSFSFYTSISNIGQFIFGSWILVAIAEQLQISLFYSISLLLIPVFLTLKSTLKFKF